MTDTITERLAEIRENYAQHERFKAADDGSVASFINTVGSAAHAAVDGIPPLLAAVEKVWEWTTSDVVTARNEFGAGYREAMRDIRDLLASALSDTREGDS